MAHKPQPEQTKPVLRNKMINSKTNLSSVKIEPLEGNKKTVALYSHDAIIVSLAGSNGQLAKLFSKLPEGSSLQADDDGSYNLVLSAGSICQFNALYKSWFMNVAGDRLEEMGIESCRILTENCFNSSLEWLVGLIYNYNLRHGEGGTESSGKDIELSFSLFEDLDNHMEDDLEGDSPQELILTPGIDPSLFFEDNQLFWNNAEEDNSVGSLTTRKQEIHPGSEAIQSVAGLFNQDEEELCCLNMGPEDFCGFYDRL